MQKPRYWERSSLAAPEAPDCFASCRCPRSRNLAGILIPKCARDGTVLLFHDLVRETPEFKQPPDVLSIIAQPFEFRFAKVGSDPVRLHV
jgi:hypothetical protein